METADQFSEQAVGIISNHGDHHFDGSRWETILRHGIRKGVYLGPLACLDGVDQVLALMNAQNLKWVYGKAEKRDRWGDSRSFPPGDKSLDLHGVLFRYFVPISADNAHGRFWEMEFSPDNQRVLLLRCLRETDARILVIGSGVRLLHLVCDMETQRIIDEYDDSQCKGTGWPVFGQTNCIHLDKQFRHIIVTPSSRTHACCILDPVRNILVGYS